MAISSFSSGYQPYDYSGINWGTSGGGSPASGTVGGFNLSPSPTSGSGAYGAVPGQLGLPSPSGDLTKQLPNLPALNTGVSQSILDASHGALPADVIAQIHDSAAQFGVANGMPGSNGVAGSLASNRGLRDIGRTSLDQQHWAASAYPGFVGAVSGTQTVNPALQNDIASQNALNRAAPNPTQRASAAQDLFNQYLNRIGASSRVPSGGTAAPQYGGGFGGNPAGGTIAPSAPMGQSAGGLVPQSGVNNAWSTSVPTWDSFYADPNNQIGPPASGAPAPDPYSFASPGLFGDESQLQPFDPGSFWDPNFGG